MPACELPTRETFAACIGSRFRITLDSGETLELHLGEAQSLGRAKAPRAGFREPFSLVFRPAGGVYVPQKMYRLEHPALGAMDLLLVPIMPDAQGMRVEAVFG